MSMNYRKKSHHSFMHFQFISHIVHIFVIKYKWKKIFKAFLSNNFNQVYFKTVILKNMLPKNNKSEESL